MINFLLTKALAAVFILVTLTLSGCAGSTRLDFTGEAPTPIQPRQHLVVYSYYDGPKNGLRALKKFTAQFCEQAQKARCQPAGEVLKETELVALREHNKLTDTGRKALEQQGMDTVVIVKFWGQNTAGDCFAGAGGLNYCPVDKYISHFVYLLDVNSGDNYKVGNGSTKLKLRSPFGQLTKKVLAELE